MGARAFTLLALYKPDPGYLVEVGSDRGEGSTAWLYDYAQRTGLSFLTADIDPVRVESADKLAPGSARHMEGQDLLRKTEPISVAYLDGFDIIPDGGDDAGFILDQRERYRVLGHPFGNRFSHAAQLAEAEALEPRTTPRCAVICDDTFEGPNGWEGKGAKAVPFLLDKGFRVTDTDMPQDNSLGYTMLRRGE